jgi:hypothetical protein
MRKLAFTGLLVVMLSIPAVALADRYPSFVSIHRTFEADRIHGVVQAPKQKCEKNRTVVLRYSNDTTFTAIDADITDNLGQYEFNAGKEVEKRISPTFDPGRYKVRVLRRRVGDDVCLRDNSREIEVPDHG